MKKLITFKNSFAFKILTIFLIFNTALISIHGISNFLFSTNILETEVTNYTQEIIEQSSIYFDANILGISSKIVSIGTNKSIYEPLKSTSPSTQEKLNYDRQMENLLRNITLFNTLISDVFILGNNGYVYNLSTRNDLIPDYPYTSQDWYKEALDVSNNVYIRTLSLHPQDYYNPRIKPWLANSQTVSISFAITDSNHLPIGAVICNFNLNELSKSLMSSNYEKNGTIALLTEEGQIISQSSNIGSGKQLELSPHARTTLFDNQTGTFRDTIGGKKCLIHFQTTVLGWKLVFYVPLTGIRSHITPIIIAFLWAFVICLIMNVLIGYFISKSIHKPVQKLVDNIYHVDFEKLSLTPTGYRYTEFDLIAGKFNHLLARLDELIKRDYLSQIQLNKFKLYALRSQINPHFLMNTLQLLQTEIVYNNVETSNGIVVSLSKLLRYTLYDYEKEVHIQDEVQYIKDYLSLFQQKYAGNLSIRYDIPPQVSTLLMPKLLLQPIVENCIKHGFHDHPQDNHMEIKIDFYEENVHFSILDDGIGMKEEDLVRLRQEIETTALNDSDIGLSNINQRVKMLYGPPYGIKIESIYSNGCHIQLIIPQIKEANKTS